MASRARREAVRQFALPLAAADVLIQKWFQWWVTEIAVTNRRVVYKESGPAADPRLRHRDDPWHGQTASRRSAYGP